MRGILSRPEALAIQPLDADIRVHPRRDPGCFHEAHKFIQPFRDDYAHALVIFDRSWEGAPTLNALTLEAEVRARLPKDWADVVVVDPEIEAWVWSDSPHVETCLGWQSRSPGLRDWLQKQGIWQPERAKPEDPKAAVERALREVKLPRSSSIYQNLTTRVNVDHCVDASFSRLRAILGRWFGPSGGSR